MTAKGWAIAFGTVATRQSPSQSSLSRPFGRVPTIAGDLFGDDEFIPVISLWQPWASLIFTGDKKHETRSFRFPAKYAGKRVAIHAAKALPKQISMGLHMLCEMNWGGGGVWREKLPRGAILGTVTLVEAIRAEECSPATIDRVCGDWTEGRFAWRLEDAEQFPEPVAAKGKQGWWKVAASVGRNPEGEDREDGLRAEHEHAVGEAETPNPYLSPQGSKL